MVLTKSRPGGREKKEERMEGGGWEEEGKADGSKLAFPHLSSALGSPGPSEGHRGSRQRVLLSPIPCLVPT